MSVGPLLSHATPAIADAVAALDEMAHKGGDLVAALNRLSSAFSENDNVIAPAPQDIHGRLASLPFDTHEAILHMALARLINRRVQEHYYRDPLVILATQEKSSSTLHEVVINEMLRHSGNVQVVVPPPRTLIAGPTAMAGGAAFHFGMLLFFPNGGVCRGVFEPNRQNRWLAGELGCRRIALIRHPADRIVAQYCMRTEELMASANSVGTDTVFQAIFRGAGLPITVDSLRHNLRWLAGWQSEAAQERVLVVRYEDMMSDLEAHFARIHDFLFGAPMSAELIAALRRHFANSGETGPLQPGDASSRVYAKGYSGKVGVWRDYLKPEDVATFNEVADRFLRHDEDGPRLRELYPDLLLC